MLQPRIKASTSAFVLLACLALAYAESSVCSSDQKKELFTYSNVLLASRSEGIKFADLPGFTRSVYERDHALVTPESRVWAGLEGWNNTLTAHIVSRANGANFAMYLADMKPEGSAFSKTPGVERFILVLSGSVEVWDGLGEGRTLDENHYAYFPPDVVGRIETIDGAGLLVYERVYNLEGSPLYQTGYVEDSPLLPTPGEVFRLRKLLPASSTYDFNVHVMDFAPGEYLNVKEVHHNQHGLLLLAGQGIYRLGNSWYPVQAGDAIWMAPYVPQWYAALGPDSTRYVIYKDTTVDPLMYD